MFFGKKKTQESTLILHPIITSQCGKAFYKIAYSDTTHSSHTSLASEYFFISMCRDHISESKKSRYAALKQSERALLWHYRGTDVPKMSVIELYSFVL